MDANPILKVMTVAAIGLAFLWTSDDTFAGTLYKWVDENGRVSYQDKPPQQTEVYEAADMSDRDVGRLLQIDPVEKLEEVVESQPITIYTADNCDACDTLRVFLEKRKVPFQEKDVSKDEDARRELVDVGEKLQVPATTIGAELLWGYSRQSLEQSLTRAGYPNPDEIEDGLEDGIEDEIEDEIEDGLEQAQENLSAN